MSEQRTLYEKVESTDDYPRWKVIYDAWYAVPDGADHGGVINLRDMVGEYFDDFMVPVEPTLQYCIRHRAMALEFAPQWCTNTGYQDRMGKKNPCVMVDAWIGEPA